MPPSPTVPPSAVTRAAGSKPASSIPRESAPARAPWFAGGLRERPLVDLAAVRENIFQLVLPNLRADPSLVHGWRLLRAIGDTYTWIDLPTLGDGIAVLGSHPECDLVLTDDPCIAHRHLAAVAVRSCKDAPHANRLRLIDLKTGVPMFGDDDEPRWAVADAALSVRVGHHLLYAYPVGPGDAANDAPDDGDLHASALGAPFASGPQSSQSSLPGGTQGRVRLTAEGRGTGASNRAAPRRARQRCRSRPRLQLPRGGAPAGPRRRCHLVHAPASSSGPGRASRVRPPLDQRHARRWTAYPPPPHRHRGNARARPEGVPPRHVPRRLMSNAMLDRLRNNRAWR